MNQESGFLCYSAHFWVAPLSWCKFGFRTTHRKCEKHMIDLDLCSALLLAFGQVCSAAAPCAGFTRVSPYAADNVSSVSVVRSSRRVWSS